MNKPCKECPYRRVSAPGYLGESSHDPEQFLQQLENPDLHPCHLTVDWDDEEDGMENAKTCVGALQFMNNNLKRSRSRSVCNQQDEAGKNPEVFQWKSEFINHHK